MECSLSEPLLAMLWSKTTPWTGSTGNLFIRGSKSLAWLLLSDHSGKDVRIILLTGKRCRAS